MFPFGSLFTQVPLMILATAYMLYLGAYALGRTKENLTENQPESKEQTIILNTTLFSDSTYNYSSNNEVKQDIDTVNKTTVMLCGASVFPEYFIPDREVISLFISYNLFSRPPPSLG